MSGGFPGFVISILDSIIMEEYTFREDEDSEDDFLGNDEQDWIDIINEEALEDQNNDEDESQYEDSQESQLSQQEDPTSWLPEFDEDVGPTHFYNEPVDVFMAFFDDELLDLIVEETNRYAEHCIRVKSSESQDGKLPPSSRLRAWTPTNITEVKAFLAIQISMGLCRQPTVEDYWSDYWLTKTPNFTKVMSRNRFQLLTAFCHFTDNSQRIPRGEEGYDALFKIRKVFDSVVAKCKELYTPKQNISIDEMMISWKGRLSFKQYLPKKPTKWGIKAWVLSESSTGYVNNFDIYTGRTPGQPATHDLGKRVVLKLTESLTDKGYIVFMDSFFSSPSLYNRLESVGTGACGTVNSNRRDLPPDIKPRNLTLKEGDHPKFLCIEGGHLVVVAWYDKRRITAISTISDCSVESKMVINGDVKFDRR